MPFVAGDPRINRKGRIDKKEVVEERVPTNRSERERELSMLLRKLKPHVADAVMTAAKIMKNESAVEHNRLRAATILLEAYRTLTLDVYNPKNDQFDEETPDVDADGNDVSPVFSLKVVGKE